MTKKRIALLLAIVMVLSASLCLLTGCKDDEKIHIGIKTDEGIIPLGTSEVEFNGSLSVVLCLYKMSEDDIITEYIPDNEVVYSVSLNRNTLVSQTISGASITFTSIWDTSSTNSSKYIKRTGTDTMATIQAKIGEEVIATDVILVSLLDNTFVLTTPTDANSYVEMYVGEDEAKRLSFEVSDRIGTATYTYTVKTITDSTGVVLRTRYTNESMEDYQIYYDGMRSVIDEYITFSNNVFVTAHKPCIVEVSVNLFDAYVDPLVSDDQISCKHEASIEDELGNKTLQSTWSDEGVCSECGMICIHDYDSEAVESTECGICGLPYGEFIADPIVADCTHESWINGRCQNCQLYQYYYERGHKIESVEGSGEYDTECTHKDAENNSTWVATAGSVFKCSQCDRVCRHLAADGYTSLIALGELDCPVCDWTAQASQSININIKAENASPVLTVNSKPVANYNAEQKCWVYDISTLANMNELPFGDFAVQVGGATYSVGNTITDYTITYSIDGLLNCVAKSDFNKNKRVLKMEQTLDSSNIHFGSNNYFDVVLTVEVTRDANQDPFLFDTGDNQLTVRFIKPTTLEMTDKSSLYLNTRIWQLHLDTNDIQDNLPVATISYKVDGVDCSLANDAIDSFSFTYDLRDIIECSYDANGFVSFSLTEGFKQRLLAGNYSDFTNSFGYLEVNVKVYNARSEGQPIQVAQEADRVFKIRLYKPSSND